MNNVLTLVDSKGKLVANKKKSLLAFFKKITSKKYRIAEKLEKENLGTEN